jgi:hypothetical protein
MRFLIRLLMVVVLALCGFSALAYAAANDNESSRLLRRAEGVALVDQVLDYPAADPWPDCSHLVHEVLNGAGLQYPYATSNQIYDGVPQFRRVSRPQAGDLIVWRGHVGVVTDPKQHRFYSSTESGPRTDNYESEYWRGRGVPRFYRFIVSDESQLVALAKAAKPAQADADSADEDNDAKSNIANFQVPDALRLTTQGTKPTKAEIKRTVDEYVKSSEAALEDSDHSGSAVVLVRNVQVKKVRTKGETGWADIRFDSRAELVSDGRWKKVKAEKVRWPLRRAEDKWEIVPSSARIYVFQQAANAAVARNRN